MFKRIVHLLAFLSLISTGLSFGQQPANPEMGSAEVKELVRRAGLGMNEYRTRFKDLTAEEEQTSEEFDEHGKLTKQEGSHGVLFSVFSPRHLRSRLALVQ